MKRIGFSVNWVFSKWEAKIANLLKFLLEYGLTNS
jgi:hypothetical protein